MLPSLIVIQKFRLFSVIFSQGKPLNAGSRYCGMQYLRIILVEYSHDWHIIPLQIKQLG